MSLRYALLAVLSAEPMTGYDVHRFFDGSLAYMWHAPHTQIYPELRRMEQDGLLGSEEVSRGEHGRKRRYHITDSGVEEFRRWVNEPLPRPRERDVHKLQAAYFEWADPEAARRQLEAHIVHHEQCCAEWEKLIAALEARTVPLLQHRLAQRPAEEHDTIVRFKVFAYRGMIARSRTEIAWAREGLALLDELHPPGRTGP